MRHRVFLFFCNEQFYEKPMRGFGAEEACKMTPFQKAIASTAAWSHQVECQRPTLCDHGAAKPTAIGIGCLTSAIRS